MKDDPPFGVRWQAKRDTALHVVNGKVGFQKFS